MSIRQQGGVFGRNPKFGTVEADEFIGPVTGTATQADAVEITDNTSSGSTFYPALMTGNSGYGPVNVSSSKLAFQPSTGMLSPTVVNAGMALANGPLTAFLSASGALYGYYSGGGIVASYSDNSGTLSALTFDGSTIALRTGNTPALSLGASDVTVNKGNLVMAASGAGIDFSATSGTGTSELFDDYEEGTWTATVGCTGNATTTTTVTAYYTKIGRQVTVGFRLLNNIDTTGLSGFFQIQGLPYACITGSTAGFAGIADWSDLTYPASVDTVTPVTSNGASTIVFSTRGSGITGGLLGATQPTSGVTDIAHFALTYFTA